MTTNKDNAERLVDKPVTDGPHSAVNPERYVEVGEIIPEDATFTSKVSGEILPAKCIGEICDGSVFYKTRTPAPEKPEREMPHCEKDAIAKFATCLWAGGCKDPLHMERSIREFIKTYTPEKPKGNKAYVFNHNCEDGRDEQILQERKGEPTEPFDKVCEELRISTVGDDPYEEFSKQCNEGVGIVMDYHGRKLFVDYLRRRFIPRPKACDVGITITDMYEQFWLNPNKTIQALREKFVPIHMYDASEALRDEERAELTRYKDALEAVHTVSERIVKAIPEYHYEMNLVAKALSPSPVVEKGELPKPWTCEHCGEVLQPNQGHACTT